MYDKDEDIADGVCCQECHEPFNGECGGQPKSCLACGGRED